MAAIGTLSQKIHCHAIPSVIAPPTTGPQSTPNPMAALKIPSARPRRWGEKAALTSASATGVTSAAPAPWTARGDQPACVGGQGACRRSCGEQAQARDEDPPASYAVADHRPGHQQDSEAVVRPRAEISVGTDERQDCGSLMRRLLLRRGRSVCPRHASRLYANSGTRDAGRCSGTESSGRPPGRGHDIGRARPRRIRLVGRAGPRSGGRGRPPGRHHEYCRARRSASGARASGRPHRAGGGGNFSGLARRRL
jgi:hypothetical protein